MNGSRNELSYVVVELEIDRENDLVRTISEGEKLDIYMWITGRAWSVLLPGGGADLSFSGAPRSIDLARGLRLV